MSEGILKKCTDCRLEKNCCMGFNSIDLPILSSKEYNYLVNNLKKRKKYFSKIDGDCYNLVAKDGVCPFYKNGCTIYNSRPNDCKLFPFDIKCIDGKYYLVLYKLECYKLKDMKKENVDDIVNEIKPYIKTFTDKDLNAKMENLDYKVIKQIKP